MSLSFSSEEFGAHGVNRVYGAGRLACMMCVVCMMLGVWGLVCGGSVWVLGLKGQGFGCGVLEALQNAANRKHSGFESAPVFASPKASSV